MTRRKLNEIAAEIKREWLHPHTHAAIPLRGLSLIEEWSDYVGWQIGMSIIKQFLDNAQMWRGERASALKAELMEIYEEGKLAREVEQSLGRKSTVWR